MGGDRETFVLKRILVERGERVSEGYESESEHLLIIFCLKGATDRFERGVLWEPLEKEGEYRTLGRDFRAASGGREGRIEEGIHSESEGCQCG